MDWTQRLNAALDYLEDTWDREPDLEHAASLAHCSSFHFLRMFEVVSGLTPGEYSRRRRLSRAAIDLAVGRDKVIDVALRYGYETPEAFTKAFKRLFNLTPTEAKVPGAFLQTWPPLRLAVVLQGSAALSFRIVEKPRLLIVGWALRTSSFAERNQREIPQFWDQCLAQGKPKLLLPLSAGLGHVGLCCEWDRDREEFTYVIGIDWTGIGNLPEGTRRFELAAAKYAVFESIGPMPFTIQALWSRVFSEWFPSSGYEHSGTPDFEVYPAFPFGDVRGDPSHPQFVSEVWIPLKRASRS